MLYSSVENSKIKELKKLHQKKYRDKTGLFLIEGMHLVKEALKQNILKEVFVLEGEDVNISFKVNYVTENVLKYLSLLDTPSNIIGVCEKKEAKLKGDKILILDEVQDPGNLGTIIRSAVAFNIDTIILGEGSCDVYSFKVLRASQGMVFHINIIKGNLEKHVKSLKDKGFSILGTKVTLGNDLKTLEKKSKFAIIMGNEGKGVKQNLLDLCDDYIYIKMNQNCESLNVAVATSIILYELDK